jgi:hypothetical protein
MVTAAIPIGIISRRVVIRGSRMRDLKVSKRLRRS